MKYRLGLDIGTASVGAAAIRLSDNGEPLDLVAHEVRIFDEPLENGGLGKLQSKKAKRRQARMQRRQIDRRAGRLRRIAALAPLLGLKREELQPDSGANLPRLRAQAARERVELEDLMRIFLRLAKRRGYAGDFRPKGENAKVGEVEGGSNELKRQMAELAEARGVPYVTLGEFLYHRLQQGFPTRLKLAEQPTPELQNLYALRSQVEQEFSHIWDTQAQYHPVLNTSRDGRPLKALFAEAIFHQRPLKSPRDLVGHCALEPTLPRAPRAQPAFQRFRIEKTLADLRWGVGRHALPLTPQQKDVIRRLLDEKEKVSFKTILAALEKAGCGQPPGRGLNLDRASRDELPGNKTNAVFRKLGLENEWRLLDERTQVQVINFLAELGSPEQLDDPQWHTRFAKADGTPRTLNPDMVAFVNRIKETGKLDRLSAMGFDAGRASYSVKALNRLADWFAEPWWPDTAERGKIDEEIAVRICYPEKSANVRNATLRYLPPAKRTGNDVVDGALRQVRFVVNRIISALGTPPHEVVVEMAREMGVGIAMRNEREKTMDRNRRARLEAEKVIREHGAKVTPSRVRRYLLWTDQGQKFCPYCNRTINLEAALSGAETEYEHIVPRSLTQVGYKRSEIVLAHRDCNAAKGNRTPWQAWGDGRDPERWQIVEERAKWFEKHKQFRKAKLLLLKDFEQEVLNDEAIADFADRQFHQTSWIAKEVAQWMGSISARPVSVSRGELTAFLRRSWKLDTVIPEVRLTEGLPIADEDGKIITPEEFERFRPVWEGHHAPSPDSYTDRRLDKRIDHRHHLIDAIVIALTSRALFQRMARQYKEDSERCLNGERPRLKAPAPPLHNLRDVAVRAVSECRLSFKRDPYPAGPIFKSTAYSVAQRDGEEKLRLTLRVPLSELINRKTRTVEQARKAIASIVSDETRALVSREFEARIAAGASAAAALAQPFYQEKYGKKIPIRRVRCYTDNYAEEVAIVAHTDRRGTVHTKRLRHAGYAYLEFKVENGKARDCRLVTMWEALRSNSKPAKGRVRLYKGDVVRDTKNGRYYRVGYFKSEGNICLVEHTDPRPFDDKPLSRQKVSFGQAGRLRLVKD
ncbi:MAG: HNH endonuclease domain-containing protein [Pseudomonadota bacterium]